MDGNGRKLRNLLLYIGIPVVVLFIIIVLVQGGGTLGNISATRVSVPTVDIGLAQLAMHSCYETAGSMDALYLERAVSAFFSAELEVRGDEIEIK